MIFISYSSKNAEYADKIKNVLEKNGIDCWMAPDSISIGDNYAKEVPKAISECKAFILVLTKEAQQSLWIPKEIDHAIKNKKPILPLKFDTAAITPEFDFFLCNVQIRNIVDFSDNTKDCSELIDTIKKIKITPIRNFPYPYWGPLDRNTFLWNERSNYPVFNSIIDNPYWGDERYFIRIRKSGETTYLKSLTVRSGESYEVTVYYHNNALSELNKSTIGIAQNVYLRIQFPCYLKQSQNGVLTACISSSNSVPTEVWDSCKLVAEKDLYIRFVANSAIIHNKGTSNGIGISGSALLGDGATLSYWDDLRGIVPSGDMYSGEVTFSIEAVSVSFTAISEVSQDGINWIKTIKAFPGEILKMRIKLINTGTMDLDNVTVRDILSKELNYLAGSTHASSSRHPQGSKSPDVINDKGLRLGTIIPKEEVYVYYEVELSREVEKGDIICNMASVGCYQGIQYDKTVIMIK